MFVDRSRLPILSDSGGRKPMISVTPCDSTAIMRPLFAKKDRKAYAF